MSFNLDDYQTVDARLDEFFAKYPDGSIQSEIVEHTDSRVTVKALAYRSASDLVPGIGLSSLAIPGSTPYTRGSELENAETSARGRALVALGFGSKASRDEIQSKAGAPSSAPQGQATDAAVSRTETPAPAAASPAQAIVEKAQKAYENRPAPTDGGNPGDVEIHFGKNQGRKLGDLSKKQVEWYASTWEPNPKFESSDDKRLKTAAQLLAGLEPTETFSASDFPSDADSIPF